MSAIIYASSAFALLQQGMKDSAAYGICLTLYVMSPSAWQDFERWAKDQLAEQDAAIADEF